MMKFIKWCAAILFLWLILANLPRQSALEIKTGDYIIHGASLLEKRVAVVNYASNELGEEAATIFDLESPSNTVIVVSKYELAFPLLTQGDRLIVVTMPKKGLDDSLFRLVEIELDEPSECKVLAESTVGIQEPFKLSGPFGDRTFFLIGSGREAALAHMPMRKIAYIEDGKIHVFKGPEVHEFGHIVQVGDGLVIGSAVSILDDDGQNVISAQGSNTYFPVEVEIGRDEISVRRSDRFGAETPGFGLAKYYPALGLTVVHSTDSRFRKISLVFDDGSSQGPVNMPTGFTFSASLDAKIGANGNVELTFLATDADGKLSIATMRLDGFIAFKAIDINDARTIRLDACGL
jgi:hypothetical protein